MSTSEETPLDPLTKRVLEIVAASMGLDHGDEHLHLYFKDGYLRRWGREDLGNGALELARYDEELRHELLGMLGWA